MTTWSLRPVSGRSTVFKGSVGNRSRHQPYRIGAARVAKGVSDMVITAVVRAMEYVLGEIASMPIPTRAITNENSPTWNSPSPTANGAMFP